MAFFELRIAALSTGSGAAVRGGSLSGLDIFQDADSICVLHPYAVRAGHSQSASLGNIFGNLDYQPWREDILKRHVDGDFWTIYSAVGGKINKSFPLNSTHSFGYKMGAKFHAGCFPPNSICIERRDDDPDKKYMILFNFCKQENQK